MSSRRICAVLLVIAPVFGCGASTHPAADGDRAGPIRFLEEDPPDDASTAALARPTPLWEWRYEEAGANLGDWSVVSDATRTTPEADGLCVQAADGRALLLHRRPFQAEAVAQIEIEIAGERIEPTQVRLAWAPAREGLSAEREAIGTAGLANDSAVHIYRFAMSTHHAWEGSVGRIRLAFGHSPEAVCLRRISFVSGSLDPNRLATALRRGIKAELDAEVRNSVPGVPGVAVERKLRLPPSATLALGYGIPDTLRLPVRFRASFVPENGGDAVSLIDTTLDPAVDAGRWHDARASLAAYPDQQGLLRLETTVDGEYSVHQGLPLWANPRVIVESSPERSRPDVVLISVDTLRPDRLSLYGYDRPTSPNLDTWAREQHATVFETAISQSTWTLPSHVSMLTGLDTFRHGVNFYDSTVDGHLTLVSELLRNAGYFTMAVTGGALLHPRYGFSQGFDRYRYFPGSRATGEELEQGLERALAWLQEQDASPFFLFFHTYEVHTPWRSRQPYFGQFSDLEPVQDMRISIPEPRADEGFLGSVDASNLDVVRPPDLDGAPVGELIRLASDAYDSGVAYTDAQIGRLLDAIARLDRPGGTVIVFTSDHGELLGEFGVVGHRYLYEQNIRVPLAIALPGERSSRSRVDSQVRSIDIVPTILDIVGIEPAERLDGESLVPLLESSRRPAASIAWTYSPEVNYGVSMRIDRKVKYTLNDTAWSPLHGRETAHSLDPVDETHDILTSLSDAPELRRWAEEMVGSAPGLRLRVRNRGDAPFKGSLAGAGIRPNRVKSVELDCRCVTYTDWTASFEALPDADYTVIIQGPAKEPFSLRLDGPGRRSEPMLEVDPTDFFGGDRLLLELGEGGWIESDSPTLPASFLEIWWEGATSGAPVSEPTTDAELLQRLRALGYIQ